ncbi:alkylation response protein AidB-like acyl-CoA dehydrogenase [Azospirillum fermentarium]|uniref:acyl-CoA dehydrogenase family protein n=1 Tax=Azospirillum fermentarium TaxID=1233114 RepID=UPI002225E3DF|nr:acyl-CoA dehydrogenase family protein [Azospirillum fermentarium]MCW2249270.1 alkylation response protein AidB-like acyl-CoA dehydrogenase [Azospirillum fermentarium]
MPGTVVGASLSLDPGSPMATWPAKPHVKLGVTGAEPVLSETEREMQRSVRTFAEKVMRPVGIALDRMTPEQGIAKDSPYWDFRKEYLKLGLNPHSLGALSNEERGRLLPIIMEEFGWGDAGLSITIGACQLPSMMALLSGNSFLIERFPPESIGCWAITEPDHGSDSLDVSGQAFHAQGVYGRPNCIATIKGDEVVINGQKAAWVSNGPIAEVCVLYCAADSGNGPDPKRGCTILVPMEAPGVSRGKVLDKIGQRPLPQGEIFFDNVTLPLSYVVAGPDDFQRAVHAIHCEANCQMGAVFTGVARAAFELAHAYAHERKQGGVPIVRHQNVAYRLFHMYRKIEASRALVQRVSLFNACAPVPALHAAMTCKITGTQTAFEVASDAIQIFGGNGLAREYPIEKIFRDARASLIEDGCNELLALKGGFNLIHPDAW